MVKRHIGKTVRPVAKAQLRETCQALPQARQARFALLQARQAQGSPDAPTAPVPPALGPSDAESSDGEARWQEPRYDIAPLTLVFAHLFQKRTAVIQQEQQQRQDVPFQRLEHTFPKTVRGEQMIIRRSAQWVQAALQVEYENAVRQGELQPDD